MNISPRRTPYICGPIPWANTGCPSACAGFFNEDGDAPGDSTGAGQASFDYDITIHTLDEDTHSRWFVYRECAEQDPRHSLKIFGDSNVLAQLDSDWNINIDIEIHSFFEEVDTHYFRSESATPLVDQEIYNALNPCGGYVKVAWTGELKPPPQTGWRLISYSVWHNPNACLEYDDNAAPLIDEIFPRVDPADAADYFTPESNIFFYAGPDPCQAVPVGRLTMDQWHNATTNDLGGTPRRMELILGFEDAEGSPPPDDFEYTLLFEEIL